MFPLFPGLTQAFGRLVTFPQLAFLPLTQPSRHPMVLSTATDLTLCRADLIAENAFLRQQRIVLQHQVHKPTFSHSDRIWLVLLARRLPSWKQALFLLKPETLLHGHGERFKRFGHLRSPSRRGRPRLFQDLVNLIQPIASENPPRGAERIRGELLQLGLPVAKATLPTYLQRVRCARSPPQN